MSRHTAVRRPLGFRLTAMASIVALHAAAILGLSHIRAQRTEAAASEPVQVAFIQEAALPVPAAPAARLQAVRPPELHLPVIELPVETSIMPPPAAVTAVASAVAAATETASDEPVTIEAPDYVRRCTLKYPPMARRMNAQGTTFVRVLVDTEGHPKDVKVHRSSGNRLLDDAAMACARQALFKPRREGDGLRESVVTIPFDFLPNVRTASR